MRLTVKQLDPKETLYVLDTHKRAIKEGARSEEKLINVLGHQNRGGQSTNVSKKLIKNKNKTGFFSIIHFGDPPSKLVTEL